MRWVGTPIKRKAIFHSSMGPEMSHLRIKKNNLSRFCQTNFSDFFRILVMACDLTHLPRLQQKEKNYPRPEGLNREVVCGFHGIASEVWSSRQKRFSLQTMNPLKPQVPWSQAACGLDSTRPICQLWFIQREGNNEWKNIEIKTSGYLLQINSPKAEYNLTFHQWNSPGFVLKQYS